MIKNLKYILLLILFISCRDEGLWESLNDSDNKTPTIVTVEAIGPSNVNIVFSKSMLTGAFDTSVENLNNYSITTGLGTLNINSITVSNTTDNNSIILNTDNHNTNQIYTIVITNIVDKYNNKLKNNVFTIDYTYPSRPFAVLLNGIPFTNNQYPMWTWASTGGGSGIFRYKLNDSDLTTGTTQTTALFYTPASALSDGTYTLYVQESNVLGNWSTASSFTITVDTTPPNPPIITGMSPTSNVTPTWSWTGGGGGNGFFRYKLDDSDLSIGYFEGITSSYTPPGLPDGNHILYVIERDNTGNWSNISSHSIVVISGMSNIKYVSNTGNDANDCNSIATACETIQEGINKAYNAGTGPFPAVVLVENGIYDNNQGDPTDDTGPPVVNMLPEVSVFGGYQNSFTTRVIGSSVIDDKRFLDTIGTTSLNPMRAVEATNVAITNTTILDGFTINIGELSNPTNYTAGVFVNNCSLTVQNNTILGRAQTSVGSNFSYILLSGAANTQILNNQLNSGYILGAGSGINGIVIFDSSPIVDNNDIILNEAANETVGIWVQSVAVATNPTISNNSIIGGNGNIANSYGIRQINAGQPVHTIITDNNIQGGESTLSGATVSAIYIDVNTTSDVLNNTIYAGTITNTTGPLTLTGVYVNTNAFFATIEGNTIWGGNLNSNNIGETRAIYAANDASPIIRKNYIHGGAGGADSYGIYLNLNSPGPGVPSVQKNRIWGGNAADKAHGIRINGGDTGSEITNNFIDGGSNLSTDLESHGINISNCGWLKVNNNTINTGLAGQSNLKYAYGIFLGGASIVNLFINNNNIFSTAPNAQSIGIFEFLSDANLAELENNNIFNFSEALYVNRVAGTPTNFTTIAAVNASIGEAELNIEEDITGGLDSEYNFVGDKDLYIFDTSGVGGAVPDDFRDVARTAPLSIGPEEID